MHYFLGSFPLHIFADRFQVIPAILLVSFDELIEVSLVPRGEALVQQIFLLLYLRVGQQFSTVYQLLLLLLLLLWIVMVRVQRDLQCDWLILDDMIGC